MHGTQSLSISTPEMEAATPIALTVRQVQRRISNQSIVCTIVRYQGKLNQVEIVEHTQYLRCSVDTVRIELDPSVPTDRHNNKQLTAGRNNPRKFHGCL
jgi:hypothetical protein